jgi:hypothetical protein
MLDRRRWFAVAGSLAAGLLLSPAEALAGLFRRKRCPPPSCCPDPCPTEQPGAYGPSITIQYPPDGATVPGTNFPSSGIFSLGYGNYCIKVILKYPDNSTYPTNGGMATVSGNGWSYQFTGAPPTPSGKSASLYATLYSDTACTNAVASDMHSIQIQ